MSNANRHSATENSEEMQAAHNKEHAKQIVLEILRLTGGHVDSTTRIFKTFYFAHLIFATNSATYLTDWPIVALEGGPGIGDADQLFKELIAEGKIEVKPGREGASTEYRLLTTDLSPLNPDEVSAIKEAVDFARPMDPAALSHYTHCTSRSWSLAEPGEELNIYIDLVGAVEYERDIARFQHLTSIAAKVWPDAIRNAC